ncbi:hypothetical protein SAY86_017816 [Trapa natans]|uniref:Cyclin-dependent kinase inhibitor domain-containing protein n=1 Tax=Trapa natans TaxID=22666 RepID=A0AAN7LQY6_TRANT|nr:hypothetical protein SAY86_017816 [Trapa natans]
MDLEAMQVWRRGRASAMTSSDGAAASTGLSSKRRRTDDADDALKVASNNSTCAPLKDSSGGQNSVSQPSLPVTSTENFLDPSTSSEDQTSVSSCLSSYETQPSEEEKDNFGFADLEQECGEANSSTSRLSVESEELVNCGCRSWPSSEVGGGEEADNLNSFLVKAAKVNPPPQTKNESHSSVGVKIPSDFEIEEFFAGAETQSLLDLELLKDKYNFDFVEEEPLEGRFEWHLV